MPVGSLARVAFFRRVAGGGVPAKVFVVSVTACFSVGRLWERIQVRARWRVDRMFSSSRYFITVRRATVKP